MTAILENVASPALLANYSSLMDAFHGAFITGVDASDIQKLVQFLLTDNPDWTIIYANLNDTGSTQMNVELDQNAYVMIPDQNTVTTTKEKIQAVMNGEGVAQVEAIGTTQ